MTNQMKEFLTELIKFRLLKASVAYRDIIIIEKSITIVLPSEKSFSIQFIKINGSLLKDIDGLIESIIESDFQQNFNH